MAEAGTGAALHDELFEALARGREDPCFFADYFCGRKLHDGQAEWVNGANATINLLLTGNRWGKTSVCTIRHLHSCFYKIGAEPRYTTPDGEIDPGAMFRLRYKTIHCAGLYETAEMVYEDMRAIVRDNPKLGSWIVQPIARTKPHAVDFVNGSRWLFRTLGDHGEGIDGNSFYLVTIDEAGWEPKVAQIVDNVARIRVADVRGRLDLVGTAKPGVSQQFFEIALRAQAYLGAHASLDHQPDGDRPHGGTLEGRRGPRLDPIVIGYANAAGIDLEGLLDDWAIRRTKDQVA